MNTTTTITADSANGQLLFPWAPTPAKPDHGARGHHPFGPSKLNAYAACPGYRPREGGASEAADEGTALHELMDKVASESQRSGLPFLETLDTVLRGQAVDNEQYSWLRSCCEQVDTFLRKIKFSSISFHNEIQVQVVRADGNVVNYGHLDLLLTWDNGRRGVLFDWKFGWIAVPPAAENLQGMNYALGVLQQFPSLTVVGVMFVQPKIKQVSMATFSRADMPELLERIDGVIRAAQSPNPVLRPNPYCDYCDRAGTCAALASSSHAALTRYEELPFPAEFGRVEIRTPEDAAKALYVIGRLETHFTAAKTTLRQKVLEAAKANDGRMEVELPGGEKLVVEARQRNNPRTIGEPHAVAHAIRDVLTPEQVLSCCDLSVTRLETLFAETLQLKGAESKAELEQLAKDEPDPEKAQALLDTAKDLQVTKKGAKEILTSVLAAEGLLTSGDGKVDYLKVRLEKGQALLTT